MEKDILEKEHYRLFGSKIRKDKSEYYEIERRLWVIHGVLVKKLDFFDLLEVYAINVRAVKVPVHYMQPQIMFSRHS